MKDEYVIRLNPEPWAIGEAFARRGGARGAGISPNRKLVSFQRAVQDVFAVDYPDTRPTREPVRIRFFFSRAIEKLNYGGKKNASASYADTTNLQKGLEDALQGILFENDNQVVSVESWMMNQNQNIDTFVIIVLEKNFTMPWEFVSSALQRQPKELPTDNNKW